MGTCYLFLIREGDEAALRQKIAIQHLVKNRYEMVKKRKIMKMRSCYLCSRSHSRRPSCGTILTYLLECRVYYLLCNLLGLIYFCLKTLKPFYIRGALLHVKGLIILEFIKTFVFKFVSVSSFGSETFKPYLEPRLKWRHFPFIFNVQ